MADWGNERRTDGRLGACRHRRGRRGRRANGVDLARKRPMASKRRRDPHKATRGRTSRRAEWALGLRPSPFTVEEPSPFRPDVLMLLDTGGDRIVDVHLVEPGMPPEGVADWAAPRVPPRTRLRVEDEEVASALADRVGRAVEVVVALTPEIDAALDHLEAFTEARGGGERQHDWSDDAADAARAGFYAAAARFEEQRPWELASDGHVLAVDVPELQRTGACASILGQAGESFGLLLLRSVDDYCTFLRLSEAPPAARRRSGAGVHYLAVNFEHPRDLPGGKKVAAMARAHGFEPGPEGRVPIIMKASLDAVSTPPTTDDYRFATACLEGVRRFVEKNGRLFAEPPRERITEHLSVAMPTGVLGVVVTAPPPDLPWRWGEEEPFDGLHEREREEILAAYRAARMAAGAAEEELAGDLWAAEEMLRFKAAHGGELVDWRPADVKVFLLDYYPAGGALTEEEELQDFPRQLDAFLGWLIEAGRGGRAPLEAARDRLAELEPRFLTEATDPSRYGPAKSLVVAMQEAGVDPTDQDAVDDFVQEYNRRLSEDPSPATPPRRRPKAWVWDGESAPPDPRAPCPCGSGRRYRKCCMPR